MINKAIIVQNEQGNIIAVGKTMKSICNKMHWKGFRYDYITKQWKDDAISYKDYLITRHQL